MIKIFSYYLTGIDATKYCQKSRAEKFAWIKKRTGLPDETIERFLDKPIQNADCGCGCGGHKKIKVNAPEYVTSGISEEITVGNEDIDVAADSTTGNPEPQRRSARKKRG